MANHPVQISRAESYANVIKQVYDNPDVIDSVAEFDRFRKASVKGQIVSGKKGMSINPEESLEKLKNGYAALKQPLAYFESLESNPTLNVPIETEIGVRIGLGSKSIDRYFGNIE